jgi:CARDB
MTERDTDIEFDFFDEPETQEAAERRRATARGGPRGPKPPRRAPPGLTPLLRLVGLVVLAIFVVVVLVFVVNSCRSSSKQDAYRDYMGDVRVLATGSAAVGREMNEELTTPGRTQQELVASLRGLARQQAQYATRAGEIRPPGPLREEHRHMVEVLELRASGLSRLADAFQRTARQNVSNAGQLLAQQATLLGASDVNWDVYFREPSTAELRRQGITGVTVPDSNFVQDADFVNPRSWVILLRRIRGAATGGTPSGLHGNGIVSVKVLPAGITLSTSENPPIPASTDLTFEVAVENSGDAQEVQIPVTLTIQKSPQPIVKKQIIDAINPGETKTVTFRDFPQPPFGTRTTVSVEIAPVRGEKNTANNSYEYPVIFSVG